MPKNIPANISNFKKYVKYALLATGLIAVVIIAIRLMPQGSVTPEASRNLRVGFDGTTSATPPEAPAPSESAPSFGAASDSSLSQTAATERKVVKEGSLSLIVKKAEETAEKIQSIARDLGGFTDGVYIYSASATSKAGTVTIRVPAAEFDGAMKKVKELAIKVESEEIGATDITAQFVDLEAWLKNLKAEEQQYVQILAKAEKVEDILDVTQYLSSVRGDIERLQAQINYLSSQVEMSTITASLTEEADVEIFGIEWRPLFTIKQAFRNTLAGLSGYIDAMISFVFILPVLALWVITAIAAFWVIRKIYHFIKAKFFAKSARPVIK